MIKNLVNLEHTFKTLILKIYLLKSTIRMNVDQSVKWQIELFLEMEKNKNHPNSVSLR
jgi:hypothetical protein